AEAIADAYHRYAGGQLRLAMKLTGSAADAEDIVQDLFVGLPEALLHYVERARFEQWLNRITARMALMLLRRRRRKQQVSLQPDLAVPSSNHPLTDVIIRQAVDALPAEQRVILILKLVEGYSHEEIAGILGITRGASEVRLHRAMRRLRAEMEDS